LRSALNALAFGGTNGGLRDDSLDTLHAVGKLLRGPKDEGFSPEAVARACALDTPVLTQFVFENFAAVASCANASLEAYLGLAEACVHVAAVGQARWTSNLEGVEELDDLGLSIVARSASCWRAWGQGEPQWKMNPIRKPQTGERTGREKLARTIHVLRGMAHMGSATQYVAHSLALSRVVALDGVMTPYVHLAPSPSTLRFLTHGVEGEYDDDAVTD
jgi:hypothetical protein